VTTQLQLINIIIMIIIIIIIISVYFLDPLYFKIDQEPRLFKIRNNKMSNLIQAVQIVKHLKTFRTNLVTLKSGANIPARSV
jgi:ABC-type bacteriocin/lantibiotic exporter with double-glycine peptidase domain